MLGATTIYVTHDQEEALSLADRIVVMRDGVIRQVGTPADLFARPDHLDVAAFMGFRNAVPGRLVSVEGERAVVEADGAQLTALLREPVAPGAAAVVAVRPDDLVAHHGETGLLATVVSTEFRGNDFTGFGRMADGTELVFSAPTALPPGTAVRLRADPDRALAFAP
jgi:putative spermidine/putrescine transport system ATP-binding protein